ncbi:MAG: alternative ribosome rescue aminoacyl-tRNA hydrolase ArfB [Desulfobulbaceae bacterium]|jgi:ribosome-associated protein|nr:alternative ribosome rescue aminoacyl-tRNA hydrolase ArfB [Desulfobulbaceae bacterium]MDY0352238.1 alternative ribosome rescue aminoacyl-tRNA hydrolase ArfB [Desulfobulbaceae bacterium]
MSTPPRTIRIRDDLLLPSGEVRFTYSRSGGPGGQNVNKISSRATLWFDVENSPTLTPYQKSKIRGSLGGRINKDGVLQISAEQYRTQKANREDALQRFAELLAAALTEKKVRKKTRMSAGARERRLQAKKRRSLLKKTSRSKPDWE